MVTLSIETIDDLIYSARAGDLDALQADITQLSEINKCPPADVVCAAIDSEPESEGGSGNCLLHFPAANGNSEILSYLLDVLSPVPATVTATATATSPENTASGDQTQPINNDRKALVSHKNHSGNTPLHWAALNTHLECVKALVAAGADVTVKNQQGFDAAFLAERAEWSGANAAREEGGGGGGDGASTQTESNGDVEMKDGAEKEAPMTEGLKVVEFLLAFEDGQEKGQEAIQNDDQKESS